MSHARRTVSALAIAAALVAGSGTVTACGRSSSPVAAEAARANVATATAAAAKYVPMSSASAADPDMEVFGNRYYVYATGGGMPVFKSKTASIRGGFTRAGSIFAKPPAGLTNLWAPHVIHVGKWYIAFFTAVPRKGGPHAIYWAYSTSPTGGFTSPRQIANGGGGGWEAIDPTTYTSPSGTRRYLVWRRGIYPKAFPIGNFQIRARGITITTTGTRPTITLAAGTSRVLAQVKNQLVMEAPSLIFRKGKLWLFVARGAYSDKSNPPDADSYRTDVWSAPGITGTFTPRGTIMKTGQGWGVGPGGTAVTAHDGIVYLTYHVWRSGIRVTRFARAVWGSGAPVARPLPAKASA